MLEIPLNYFSVNRIDFLCTYTTKEISDIITKQIDRKCDLLRIMEKVCWFHGGIITHLHALTFWIYVLYIHPVSKAAYT